MTNDEALRAEVASYKAGNTALLEALMDMVFQHFHENQEGFLNHQFISSDEAAIEVLLSAGMAEHVSGKGYRLLWDKLADRKAVRAAAAMAG